MKYNCKESSISYMYLRETKAYLWVRCSSSSSRLGTPYACIRLEQPRLRGGLDGVHPATQGLSGCPNEGAGTNYGSGRGDILHAPLWSNQGLAGSGGAGGEHGRGCGALGHGRGAASDGSTWGGVKIFHNTVNSA